MQLTETILTMDLSQVQNIPILKDITFWHALSVTACSVVGWMLHRHLDKTEETLKDIKAILNSVVIKNAEQEVKIEHHEKRLEKLENG